MNCLFRLLRPLPVVCYVFSAGIAFSAHAEDLNTLLSERAKSVVAVEFYVQAETERHPGIVTGVVIDHEGTIILPGQALPTYLPPSQFKEFRVYRAGGYTTDYTSAEYLGFDAASGWHFVRVEPKGRVGLVPLTDFVKDTKPAEVGQEVWGMSVRSKDEDFAPVYHQNRVGFIARLPQATALADGAVSGPQLPVFDLAGNFVGLGAGGFGETFAQYSRTERGSTILLISGDQTRVFHLASDILPYLSRIPHNILSRPSPWLGVMGVQPLPPEVAKFMKLEDHAALVVSEVLEGGPAEKAGMKDHDIILALDGQPLPRLRPAHAVGSWLEREVALRAPGAPFPLTVLRGSERVELKINLAEEPKTLREAERVYFERLGFSAREFVYVDAVAHHIKQSERLGFAVHFVKSNSPAAAAGLRAEDWVREIDGVEVKTYVDAVAKLSSIEKDSARAEFVLLISRGGETAVLRVKLH